MHETCYTCNIPYDEQLSIHKSQPIWSDHLDLMHWLQHDQRPTHKLLEVIKAANLAHIYQVTVGLYGDQYIEISPKTAEI